MYSILKAEKALLMKHIFSVSQHKKTIFQISHTIQKQTSVVNLILSADSENRKIICVGGLFDRKWTGNYVAPPSAAVLTMLIRFLM